MKRCTLLILLLLVLGAVTNIAIAWGCMLRRPYFGAAPISSSADDGGTWGFPTPETWPTKPRGHWEQRGIGWRMRTNTSESAVFSVNRNRMSPPVFKSRIWRCGWPMHSLTSIIVTEDASNELAAGIVIPDLILKLSNWDPPCLPTKPDPLGFTVNTLFYAAIPAIPLLLLGPVRRWRRLRSGLCPRCKYPIAASPVCTECGAALPPQEQPT